MSLNQKSFGVDATDINKAFDLMHAGQSIRSVVISVVIY
jgi:Zn-dependent alcohol dehydrogenase